MTYAINAMFDAHGSPPRMAHRCINTSFSSAAIVPPLPPDELVPRFAQADQRLEQSIADHVERWEDEWQPALARRASMSHTARDPAEECERRLAEAREVLRGEPQPVADQFEQLLKAARAGTVPQEDHNHWSGQRYMCEVRWVAQELGRRLAHAVGIEQVDDVFHLTADEEA